METTVKLIDMQPEIAAKADELYKDKRFVGIVLSTGGGKSFLAMDRIVKQINEHNKRVGYTESNSLELSDCPLLYFSPTNIVNGQFRTHMAKYVIAPEYLKQDIREHGPVTVNDASQTLTRLLLKLNIAPKDDELRKLLFKLQKVFYETDPGIDPEKAVLDIIREQLEKADTPTKTRIVHDAFPNMHFKAYKNLDKLNIEDLDSEDVEKMQEEYEESLEDSEVDQIADISQINPELIVFDEAHRTGAPTWWPRIERYIQDNETARVLAITATPERDVDEQNMMKKLAAIPGMGYSVRERREKKYLAADIPLMKAIKLELVNPPDVVHFPMTLDETTEFEKMLKLFIKSVIKDETVSRYAKNYYDIKQKATSVEHAFGKMLYCIRKSPFIDDSQETLERINGKIDEGTSFYKDRGLIGKLRDAIKDCYFEKGIRDDNKGIKVMLEACQEVLKNEIWEDGKSWEEVKQERISKLITTELEKRGITHGKALTFIDSMPRKKGNEPTKKKRSRALEYIKKEIDKIKKRIGLVAGIEPDVCALHSTAYTAAENDVILDSFMKASTEDGPFKIISAVQKFNEGFHPDGISAEFMLKEITENENKANEPRIVLLQQLGRVLSAGKKEKAVVFDLANNFMRNHSRFLNELKEHLSCYSFLELTEEEQGFLSAAQEIRENSTTRTVVDHKIPETIRALSVIMRRIVGSPVKQLDKPLHTLIEQIGNEELKNTVLDELYLAGIELDEHGDLNIGQGLNYIKDAVWNVNSNDDSKVIQALAGMSVQDLKNLGILDTTKDGLQEMETARKLGRPIINSRGFIVGGKLGNLYKYNIFTGTLYDGPENDPTSVDFYGCRPDGYDPAGYDRYGFNRAGIHKMTGMPYDERMFTRLPDGRWVNLLRERGSEDEELDLLGFNHDGINPYTGFDRDGFWHERQEDGSFSDARTKYNDKGLDVHGFSRKGEYLGMKNILTNNGLFSNGTRHSKPESPEEKSDRYDNRGYDIDGFDMLGFNMHGIHKDTGLEYDLEGHDRTGKLNPDLSRAAELIERIGRVGIERLLKTESRENLGEIIAKGFAASSIFIGIAPNSRGDLLAQLVRIPKKARNDILNLPIGNSGRTIRDMNDDNTEYVRKMLEFYNDKIKQYEGKNERLATEYSALKDALIQLQKPIEQQYRPHGGAKDFVR